MMVALGVSGYGGEAGAGYSASLFHLFTHAFFKALLFLGAGSVIHAVHSNLMTEMGGLRKQMPITHFTFLIACLTISGIPPFSGFFSKDEILVAIFNHNQVIFYVQWLVAGITAFYMFRLYFSIFWNNSPQYKHTPHESPATMTIPLLFLAIASAFTGFVPFGELVTSDGKALHASLDLVFALSSSVIALLGIGLAAFLYLQQNERPKLVAESLRGIYTTVYRKFFIDEIYLFVTHKILFQLVAQPVAWLDKHVVDGAVNLVANSTERLAVAIKRMQSGQVQWYIWFFTSGALLLVLLIMFLN
jgi:NADH-quinone oxidoreductase subunit L